MTVVAANPASLNVPRPRKYYKGTTVLNLFYDEFLPYRDAQRRLKMANEDLDDSDSDAPTVRRADYYSEEPIFPHLVNPDLWEELIYDFDVGAVIDLTAGDGAAAWAARAG